MQTTMTKCDVCGRRDLCVVQGTAMCRSCCPSAFSPIGEESEEQILSRRQAQAAERLRQQSEAVAKANKQWEDMYFPPAEDYAPDPNRMLQWGDVRHILCPEFYSGPKVRGAA